jgi:hypothetical protein
MLYEDRGGEEPWRGVKAGLIAAGLLAALTAVPLLFTAGTAPLAGAKWPWACAKPLGALVPGPAADQALHEPEPCASGLAVLVKRIWSFLISDAGQFFFASAATLRAVFFYLRRSPLPEANRLADYLIAALVLLILAGMLETRSIVRYSLQCQQPRPLVMAAWQPPARLDTKSA